MADKIQIRRDTAAQWALVNPVLASGEFGIVQDPGNRSKLKTGDGYTYWNNLPFLSDVNQASIDALLLQYEQYAHKGMPGGYAPLNNAGKVDPSFLPPVSNNSFSFNQSTPSALWTIPHGLGFNPGGIIVQDSAGTQVIGDVRYTSLNVLTISFGAAFSGQASLS